jgi:hypothetical protein
MQLHLVTSITFISNIFLALCIFSTTKFKKHSRLLQCNYSESMDLHLQLTNKWPQSKKNRKEQLLTMRVLATGVHASTPVTCVGPASYLITYRVQAVQVKFMPALAWKCSMIVECSKAIRLLVEGLHFSKHAVMTYENASFVFLLSAKLFIVI